MATKEQIKKTILSVAGNPESGVVAEYAERWAEAISALDSVESLLTVEKETRVTKAVEQR